MNSKIAFIGSSVVDVILHIPHLPQTAQDLNIASQQFAMGGCAWNAASICRRFQVPCMLCTPVGTGIYGDYVKAAFQREQIELCFESEEENGCCYCLVEESGERTFLAYHGTEYKFRPEWFEDLDKDHISTVYVCGLELEEDTGIHILHYLQNHPHLTIYFAPGPRIMQLPQSMMDAILDLQVILHLNEEEALSFTKTNTVEEAAHVLYRRTHSPLIITLGKQGAAYVDETGKFHIVHSEPVVPIDTIGAGDAHIGTIIARRFLQDSWEDAVRKANQVAAAVVSTQGATLNEDEFNKLSL